MSKFEQSAGATDEWYTPPYIFAALACTFDMDVACPVDRTHVCVPAREFITHDSLSVGWCGFVWMNPPFGGRGGLVPWLDKFFKHGDGVALMPDRTSALWWRDAAAKCDGLLFTVPKVKFIDAKGKPGAHPSTGTTLMAAGPRGVQALKMASAQGLGTYMVLGD